MDTISGVVPFLVAHVAQGQGADAQRLLEGSGVDATAFKRWTGQTPREFQQHG